MISEQVQFRPAIPGDSAAVADVYLTSFKQFLPFTTLAHIDDEVRQWISDHLFPSGGVTIAVLDSRIIGMMAVACKDGIGWIDQLYLHPDAVNQGVGTQLLARALSELKPPIRLYTFQANTGARRFYERHGFKAIEFGDGSGNEENCPDVLYEWLG